MASMCAAFGDENVPMGLRERPPPHMKRDVDLATNTPDPAAAPPADADADVGADAWCTGEEHDWRGEDEDEAVRVSMR